MLLLIVLPLIAALEVPASRDNVCLNKFIPVNSIKPMNQFCNYPDGTTVFSYVNRQYMSNIIQPVTLTDCMPTNSRFRFETDQRTNMTVKDIKYDAEGYTVSSEDVI